MYITLIQIFVIKKSLHFVTGAVYRGKYKHEPVAVKEFLTQSQVEAVYDEYDDTPGVGYSYREVDEISEIMLNSGSKLCIEVPTIHSFLFQDDNITSGEALFLYRDMRQEVTVLAQLSHPNIVSLLGKSSRHCHHHLLYVFIYRCVSTTNVYSS